MRNYKLRAGAMFDAANYIFLSLVALLCLLPLVQIVAISLSSSAAAEANLVKLWPVDFNWTAYDYAAHKPEFIRSLGISVIRIILGVGMSMFITILVAFPLSKESNRFRTRTLYVWLFVFVMLFHGGLIPTYMIIKMVGLTNTIWALVVPEAVAVFNIVLLLNFYRAVPKELEEAGFIDGAGYWKSLWVIYVPLSMPAIATLILFSAVGHWNAWFDGMIYLKKVDQYPLSTYLRTVVLASNVDLSSTTDAKLIAELSSRTLKAAQIFLGALPILLVYPFLQRFFVKGIVLGSVKE